MLKIKHEKKGKSKNKKGFTLIELIVVIAILGILASVLVPQLSGFTERAKMAQVLTDASAVATVADALYVESGEKPLANDIIDMAGVQGEIINGSIKLSDTTPKRVLFEYSVGGGTVVRKEDGGNNVIVELKK